MGSSYRVRVPGRSNTGKTPVSITLSAGLAAMCLYAGSCFAAALGLLTDNETDQLHLFDAGTGSVIASLQGSPGRINGDCALSGDETTGFTSNAGRNISVFRFISASTGRTAEVSSIAISNAGVDLSLSPDGHYLVSVGAGNIDEPLSIIDTASQREVATNGEFLDNTSAEFCDDGTLLLTTTYGHSFARPFDNAIYDARLGPGGELQLAGSRLSSGATPSNSSCAPGSRAGVLLDREAGLTSFTLPGIRKADFVRLHGGTAVAAVFNGSGDRLYVRTSYSVEAFNFNPFNGTMQADWIREVPFSAEYFGIDQIAIDPADGNLYVDGGSMLLILDPDSGDRLGRVSAGDATGVCFAQQQPRRPAPAIAQTAP